METTLYADVLFLVNFSMDFISLWAAAMLTSSRRSAPRMSLAAAIGAIYGVASVIISLEGLLTYISAAAVSIIMCAVAFGKCGGAFGLVKCSALIWGSGALLGGVMTFIMTSSGRAYTAAGNSVGSPFALVAAVAAALVYITARLLRSRSHRKQVDITVKYGGKSITLPTLCDSGNLLCDPISGDPVIAVSADALQRLTGEKISTALAGCDIDTITAMNLPVRIIPHSSAGGSGTACALLPDRISVRTDRGSRDIHCLVAPLPVPEGYFGGCAATVQSNLIF